MKSFFEKKLKNLGLSKNTIMAYLNDIDKLIENGITNWNLSFFKTKEFLELKLAPASINRMGASVKRLAKFLRVDNPLEYEELPKIGNTMPKILSFTEFQELLKETKNKEIKAILNVLYSTGCRINSLSNLKIEDIVEDSITFENAKGNKPYVSILTDETRKAIKDHIGERTSGYVFCKPNGEKFSSNALRNRMRSKMKDKYINPHAFRHSIATQLINNGAELIDVSEFLNHSSISTTQKYVHLSSEQKRKRLKDHHPMLKD